MEGISPRYVQDKISNALVNEAGEGTINPFMVMNELDKGLRHHSLITSDEQRKRFAEIIGLVKREYEEIVKNEVQRAISADEEAIMKLAANYIDNIKAFTLKERVKNKYTGQDEDPDERLMRSIEEEDRHRRESQRRLPARDHELHRRPRGRRQEVRVEHERSSPPRARAEALRRSEGQHQAEDASSPPSSTKTRRRRSTSSRRV